jgi:FkbM family methyltransferase
VIPQLRNTVLRHLARVLIQSGTFRGHLGAIDANYDPWFLRAAALLRDASNEEAVFVRDLVNIRDQDIALWVLHETRQKTGGFFVEFGAADGIIASNTALLERDFGWRGILAEPNPDWHAALLQNRHAAIDLRCVFTTSGARVSFAATRHPGLATIVDYIARDSHARSRAEHRLVEVETVSLNDLLDAHDAPRDIDFISIDTEGSEYEILDAFDFDRRNVLLFSVEHNQTDREQKIDELMHRNGYQRRFPGYATGDAWYRRA